MVNDLQTLLNDNVASPPRDHFDLERVLARGRRRVRRRRLATVGAAAITAAVLVGGAVALPDLGTPDFAAAGVPQPQAPTLRLADATKAVEGTDYRLLASHTNEDLNADNGQYYDGVTGDGLVLFRDGPRMDQLRPRFALLDPATGEKDWLPDLDVGQAETKPLELGRDRLVLVSLDEANAKPELVVHVFDRGSRQWDTREWAGLPAVEDLYGALLGPDDRLYVPVPATQGQPPEGGWPTSPDGDAEDADADGDTYRLWSASLTDPSDVRDEALTVGSVAFTGDSMVWTDSTNGDAGRVHVRNLETGQARAFDPHSGARCNLLSFGAVEDRIVMGQYCGTYDGGVRDDRVQVLDTDGDQVVTLQGNGIEGAASTAATDGLVTVTSSQSGNVGTYVYDLGSERLLRITEQLSSWSTGGPAPAGQFLWNTPVNRNRGMTEHLGELIR